MDVCAFSEIYEHNPLSLFLTNYALYTQDCLRILWDDSAMDISEAQLSVLIGPNPCKQLSAGP